MDGWMDGRMDHSIDWKHKTITSKVTYIITLPITIAFNFSIPRVEEETYNRMFNTLCPIVAPLLVMYAVGCTSELQPFATGRDRERRD